MMDDRAPAERLGRGQIAGGVVDEDDIGGIGALRLGDGAIDGRIRLLHAHVVRDVFVIEEAGAEQVAHDVAPVRRLGVRQADDAVVGAQPLRQRVHAAVAGGDEVVLGARENVGCHAEQRRHGGDIGGLGHEAETEIAVDLVQLGALGRRQRVGRRHGVEDLAPQFGTQFDQNAADIENEELRHPAP